MKTYNNFNEMFNANNTANHSVYNREIDYDRAMELYNIIQNCLKGMDTLIQLKNDFNNYVDYMTDCAIKLRDVSLVVGAKDFSDE